MNSRINNFDFLRLIFASLVVITHSYALSKSLEGDILSRITNGNMELSYIGVHGFFIISGYLIFKSLLQCKNLVDFYWKRILRLFPALFIVLFLTVLLAPTVYENSVPYLENKSVYTYIPQNLTLFFRQKGIEGVFKDNPYGNNINGSLWTICYEFSMYMIVSLLFFIRNFFYIKIVVVLLFVSSYILNVFHPHFFYGIFFKMGLRSNNFYNLMCFFAGGMTLTYLNINKKTENIIILLSLAVLIISLYFNISKYTNYFTLPLLVILIGKSSTLYINKIGETIGDTSYGIYIYSFPVQQALIYFFKFDAIVLMAFSLPLSVLFGCISWHLIEKKALEYKNIFAKKTVR